MNLIEGFQQTISFLHEHSVSDIFAAFLKSSINDSHDIIPLNIQIIVNCNDHFLTDYNLDVQARLWGEGREEDSVHSYIKQYILSCRYPVL
jgi:hypothetical protein